MASAKKTSARKSVVLYRSETNKVIGGVCGGLAEALQIDATLLRILFLVALVFGGTGFILYVILWIVIPSESRLHHSSNDTIKENIEELKERALEFTEDFQSDKDPNSNRLVFGLIVIGLGVMFLLNNFGFGRWFNFDKLWPVLIIIVGFFLLTKRNE